MLLLILIVLTFLLVISSDSPVVHWVTWTESVVKRCHPDCFWTFFFLETNQPENDYTPFFLAVSCHVYLHWNHVWFREIMWDFPGSQSGLSNCWICVFKLIICTTLDLVKIKSKTSQQQLLLTFCDYVTAFKVNPNENRKSRCRYRCHKLQ